MLMSFIMSKKVEHSSEKTPASKTNKNREQTMSSDHQKQLPTD